MYARPISKRLCGFVRVVLATVVVLLCLPSTAASQTSRADSSKSVGFSKKFSKKFPRQLRKLDQRLEELKRAVPTQNVDTLVVELRRLENWRTNVGVNWQQKEFKKRQKFLLKRSGDLRKSIETAESAAKDASAAGAKRVAESSQSRGDRPKPKRRERSKPTRIDGPPPRSDCEPDSRLAWSDWENKRYAKAFDFFCPIVSSGCKTPDLEDAERMIQAKRDELEASFVSDEEFGAWERNHEGVVDALVRCYPELKSRVASTRQRIESARQVAREKKLAVKPVVRDASSLSHPRTAPVESATSMKRTINRSKAISRPRLDPMGASRQQALTFDIWQSAWGDFSDFDKFVSYARRNHIKAVNLNLGMPINQDWDSRAFNRLSELSGKLRAGGVQKINLMYAELSYPIGGFAAFLQRHKDTLNVDTIVDDSEFIDAARHRFTRNRDAVVATGIRYGAFVTLEKSGNSGVSDETRFWVLEHVQEPILMSYFACSLPEQQKWVGKYLEFADEKGRYRDVKIALLLGGKSVGREFSCEKELSEAAFQTFLSELHDWGLSYRSYGGIALETNRQLPRYDIARDLLDWSRAPASMSDPPVPAAQR